MSKSKKHTSAVIHDATNVCLHFVQFVHFVYIQKTYKGSFIQLLVQILYSLHIVCTDKKHISSFKLFSLCTLCNFLFIFCTLEFYYYLLQFCENTIMYQKLLITVLVSRVTTILLKIYSINIL